MKSIRSIPVLFASAALAAVALGAAGSAQARSDVSWSVGIGAPGAQVVVGNAPRYYAAPAPVYYPQPVYVQPRPVYYPQPVYVQPRPVYVSAPVYVAPPPPVWVRPGRGYGHRHHDHGPGWYR